MMFMLLSCTKEENGPYVAQVCGAIRPQIKPITVSLVAMNTAESPTQGSIPSRKLHSKPCKVLEHPFGGRLRLENQATQMAELAPFAIQDTFVQCRPTSSKPLRRPDGSEQNMTHLHLWGFRPRPPPLTTQSSPSQPLVAGYIYSQKARI